MFVCDVGVELMGVKIRRHLDVIEVFVNGRMTNESRF